MSSICEKKYRKKPIVIEAIQFTDESKDIAFNFVNSTCQADFDNNANPIIKIDTLEGVMTVVLGDWIIKGTQGEFYPCKPDIFEQIYELVEGGNV